MGAGASAQKSKASFKSKVDPKLKDEGSAAEQPVVSATQESSANAANPATDAPNAVEGSDLAMVEFSPPSSPIPDTIENSENSNGALALQESDFSPSPEESTADASMTVMPPAPARLSTVEYTGDLRAWKTAQLMLEKPSFSARVVAAVVRRAKKLDPPPTPSFNLPEGGWGTDPAAVIAGLRERHGVPKRAHQATKAEHNSSSRKGSEGPSLDWACLGVQDLPNTELKYFRGKTSVDLSHNPLSELPIGFGHLTTLKHLNLHDCDLGDGGLPRSTFSGLTHLSVLDLSCNLGITEVFKDFGSLFRLKRLVLHGCRIFRVDDAISNLKLLERFELQHNRLTSLPPGLIRLRNLNYLDAEHNKIDFLPIFFGRGVRGSKSTRNLVGLKRLNLGVNHLQVLPAGLPGLATCEALWLQRNYLSALPEDIGDLESLKQLCIYGNHLTFLPDSIGNLTSLESLAANDNKLGPDLPESLFGMVNLLQLDVSDNHLTSLPSRLGELPKLKHLWCARNQLTSLPDSLARMNTLESLHLHENKLAKLPDNVSGWSHMRVLTLSKNKLVSLPNTLRFVNALERLSLDHNIDLGNDLVQQGMFFTELHNLAALSLDRFVYEACTPEAQRWVTANVADLKILKTVMSKAKMKEALFGKQIKGGMKLGE